MAPCICLGVRLQKHPDDVALLRAIRMKMTYRAKCEHVQGTKVLQHCKTLAILGIPTGTEHIRMPHDADVKGRVVLGKESPSSSVL